MKWISVKDELPEDRTSVLSLSAHNVVNASWYVREDIQFYPYAHLTSEVPLGEVTHWMPIPERPKLSKHKSR